MAGHSYSSSAALHAGSDAHALPTVLKCGPCGQYVDTVECHVLPCQHRFCAPCLRRIPGLRCPTCNVPYFENELLPCPYTKGVLDKFSSLTETLRRMIPTHLREQGVPSRAEGGAPRTMSADAIAAANERKAIEGRMLMLERQLRAQHSLILSNTCGVLAGTLDWAADPSIAPAELLQTPRRPPERPSLLQPDAAAAAAAAAAAQVAQLFAAAADQQPAAAASAATSSSKADPARGRRDAPTAVGDDGDAEGGACVSPRKRAKGPAELTPRGRYERQLERTPEQAVAAPYTLPPAPASLPPPAVPPPAPPQAPPQAPHAAASASAATSAAAAAAAAAAAPMYNDSSDDESPPPAKSATKKVVINTSGLTDGDGKDGQETNKSVQSALRAIGGSYTKKADHNMTHLVTVGKPSSNNAASTSSAAHAAAAGGGGSRDLCSRTIKYMSAVIHGKWVVDAQWVTASRKAGYWVDEKPYEFAGDTAFMGPHGHGAGGPRNSRHQHELKKAQLLLHWHCYLAGSFRLTEKVLIDLLQQMGATATELKSSAPPKAQQQQQQQPKGKQGVVQGNTRRRKSSVGDWNQQLVIIVEQKPSELPPGVSAALKEMGGVPVVRLDWVFDSISNYEVMALEDYPPHVR